MTNYLITAMQMIERGGWIMMPLMFLLFVGFTITFKKIFQLYRSYKWNAGEFSTIMERLREDELTEVMEWCKNKKHPFWDFVRVAVESLSFHEKRFEAGMQYRAQQVIDSMESHLELLEVVITAAPLLGLLGTITGMMSTFSVLGSVSDQQSRAAIQVSDAITAGVGEALIATGFGLGVALIFLFIHNYLRSRIRYLTIILEQIGALLLDFYLERRELQVFAQQWSSHQAAAVTPAALEDPKKPEVLEDNWV